MKEKEHSSALNGDNLRLKDVIENFCQSYYRGDNGPYSERSPSSNRFNESHNYNDRNNDHQVDNMRNGVNGTSAKNLLRTEMKNHKKENISDMNNHNERITYGATARTDLLPFDFTLDKDRDRRSHSAPRIINKNINIDKNINKNINMNINTNKNMNKHRPESAPMVNTAAKPSLLNMGMTVNANKNITGNGNMNQNGLKKIKKTKDIIDSVLWPDERTPEIYGARVLGPKNRPSR